MRFNAIERVEVCRDGYLEQCEDFLRANSINRLARKTQLSPSYLDLPYYYIVTTISERIGQVCWSLDEAIEWASAAIEECGKMREGEWEREGLFEFKRIYDEEYDEDFELEVARITRWQNPRVWS